VSRHLLTVWNPSYSEDALDQHLQVLLEWARRHRNGEVEEDDVYVWWAKIRSPNRRQELPHADEILALDAQTQAEETHLYLTDYRSLYVAWLGEVTGDDVRDEEAERAHMPEYYVEAFRDHEVDAWFRLFDLRRLVAEDTPGTIRELRTLRNTRYGDKPVSLYGGIVDLPLLVTRRPRSFWFRDREVFTEGALWAEREAAFRSDVVRLDADLRDNLFGRAIWAALEPGTRSFLASAEAVFRSRRGERAFDLSGAAMGYGKAVEVEVNRLVFEAARRGVSGRAPADRTIRLERESADLAGEVRHQTVGSLVRLLEHSGPLRTALRTAFPAPGDQDFLLEELPARLREIGALRNRAAHDSGVTIEELLPVRNGVVGVGCESLLVRVVQLRDRRR
jgi:hypothetical protein